MLRVIRLRKHTKNGRKWLLADKSDIKVLIIYKQHYREKYEIPLNSQFSCFGYYDGVSITSVNDLKGSELLEKRTHSPISTLWYATQKASSQISGRFSEQIVGLFRKSDDSVTDDFINYPYLSVCFLQVDTDINEIELSHELEEKLSHTDSDASIFVKAFLTFDNASIICISYSNSMYLLCRHTREIERYDGVLYSHSIFSVNEEYLKLCSQQQRIEAVFNGKNTHIYEEVFNLSLRISHGGSFDFGMEMLRLLNACNNKVGFEIAGIDEAEFYYKQGHINSVIVLPRSNVKALLALFVNNGLGTHQNKLYEDHLYSIETSFSAEKGKSVREAIGNSDEKVVKYDWLNSCRAYPDISDVSSSWTASEIKRYLKYAEEEYKAKNDAAYSGYMGIVKSLNSVAQYENYRIGRELFYVLYPAFDLFDRLIEDARGYKQRGDRRKYAEIQEAVKLRINEFISAVNQVLYHTVHSDQLFFMLPGYSGVSYSISQKLLMFYQWYCCSLIRILNDEDHEYQALITPVMEDVASAVYLDFKTDSRDRVIYVRISQRAMSFPRHNMIVLGHEIGHYVGDGVRSRRFRLIEMCQAVGILISECSWAIRTEQKWENEKVEGIFNDMVERLRQVTANRYAERMAEMLVRSRPNDKFYYGDVVEEILVYARKMMLEEKDAIWREAVPRILDMADGLSKEERELFLSRYRMLMDDERFNRSDIVSSGQLDSMVLFIMTMFREVYSDITAFSVLDCDYMDFRESFIVSEGQEVQDAEQDMQIKLRLNIAKRLYTFEENSDYIDKENSNRNIQTTEVTKHISNGGRMRASDFHKNFFEMSWLSDILIEYASHCQAEIADILPKNKEKVEAVRKAYGMFDGSYDGDAEDTYAEIRIRNQEYRKEIKEMLDK